MKALSLLLVGSVAASSLFAGPRGDKNRPAPEEVVAQMIGDFDINENDSLAHAELSAALADRHAKRQAMREQRQAERGDDAKKRKGPGKGPRDPNEMATRLIERFDADGDSELGTSELLAAVESMQKRGGKRGNKRKGDDS